MKDLVVLVADKDAEYALRGLLERPRALGIRQITYDIFVHQRHDPGCFRESHNFLRAFASTHGHALIMFDFEGSGRDGKQSAEDLAESVLKRLQQNGWPSGRAEVIVLVPELEIWVWNPSPHVARALGWEGDLKHLRKWLCEVGYWPEGDPKPPRPKEAMEAAMRRALRPRSSSVYWEIARNATLSGHNEPAFCRLVSALRRWFPA